MSQQPLPIYYLEMTVMYNHGKSKREKKVWCISNSDDVMDIMDDRHAMSTIERQLYAAGSKTERKVTIKKIHLCKYMGMQNKGLS
jgi:hypothetical protein